MRARDRHAPRGAPSLKRAAEGTNFRSRVLEAHPEGVEDFKRTGAVAALGRETRSPAMARRNGSSDIGLVASSFACALLAAPQSPAQTLHWARNGASSLDEFGTAVAGAGDVDGDGIDDVIVGAYRADAGSITPGRATVHSGRDGSVLLSLVGRNNDEWFGHAVGAAGDVDGDGFGDVYVSAPNRAAGTAGLAGCVTLFSGRDGHEFLTWSGGSVERLGWSVANLGDVDGDGRDEFVLGGPRWSGRGSDRGRVHLVSAAGGAERLVLEGEMAGDWFGVSVAACGDFDGDGAPDFAVGADRRDLAGADQGRAYVHALDGRRLATFDGAAANDRFGATLAGVGDFDGDGRGDLLVGAPQHDAAGLNAGRASLFGASGPAALLDLDGDAAGDSFGSALAAIGDFDGDSIGDFAVGAWANDEAGGSAGKVIVYAGATGAELFSLLGAAATERFGVSVAGAGDVDGSGCADLIVGASYCAALGSRTGRADVYRSDYELIRLPEITSVMPPRGHRRDAAAVTIVGDEFLAGGATVSVGGVAIDDFVVVDDETITCVIPPGEPGPYDVTVTTRFGSATRPGGFVRTAALLVEGTPELGGELTLRWWCEPDDLVIGFFGEAPASHLRIGKFDGFLEIEHLFILFATTAAGNEIVEKETIPDEPELVGLEVLLQGAVMERWVKRRGFTNCVSITIE